MKWLCEWGPEIVDESLRPPSACLPACIQAKSVDLLNNKSAMRSHEEIRSLLRDSTQQWDRIILPMYDPEFFKSLNLHPCQELYLIFGDQELSHHDIRNLAKCANLRIFDLGVCHVSTEGMQVLRHLPNLRKLMFGMLDAFPTIELYMNMPQLPMFELTHTSEYFYVSEEASFPFRQTELPVALSVVRDRRHTLRQIRLYLSTGTPMLSALGSCTQVESVCISDIYGLEENDLSVLFEKPELQKTLRHVSWHIAGIDAAAALNLKKCTNLLWIEFNSLLVSTEQLIPVILANADHLLCLTVMKCPCVGDEILEAIAACKRLKAVHLHEMGVSIEAVQRFRSAKRPNWDKLIFKKTDVTTGMVYAIKFPGEDMVAYQDL